MTVQVYRSGGLIEQEGRNVRRHHGEQTRADELREAKETAERPTPPRANFLATMSPRDSHADERGDWYGPSLLLDTPLEPVASVSLPKRFDTAVTPC